MKVIRASAEDLPVILDLLAKCGLPTQGVHENRAHFFVLKEREKLAGCIGMEVYGDVGMLRSLAVIEEKRGLGYGNVLTRQILSYSGKKKIKRLYLLTTHAEGFFSRFGFVAVGRDSVDLAIKKTGEFSEYCPLSVTVMVKKLI
jgi:amino-acid N-acetyltransferase